MCKRWSSSWNIVLVYTDLRGPSELPQQNKSICAESGTEQWPQWLTHTHTHTSWVRGSLQLKGTTWTCVISSQKRWEEINGMRQQSDSQRATQPYLASVFPPNCVSVFLISHHHFFFSSANQQPANPLPVFRGAAQETGGGGCPC